MVCEGLGRGSGVLVSKHEIKPGVTEAEVGDWHRQARLDTADSKCWQSQFRSLHELLRLKSRIKERACTAPQLFFDWLHPFSNLFLVGSQVPSVATGALGWLACLWLWWCREQGLSDELAPKSHVQNSQHVSGTE